MSIHSMMLEFRGEMEGLGGFSLEVFRCLLRSWRGDGDCGFWSAGLLVGWLDDWVRRNMGIWEAGWRLSFCLNSVMGLI